MKSAGAGDSDSLNEMAQRDLDAALQLLADRAQYITGASGAAIALKRDGRKDMLCRASTGSNAPELGALLSAEFGLSGESVRTRRLLRCDDAERDARVNREVCRQLGIASVIVMPVVNDDEVLGVFELFSGRTHAFGERDLSAVQRLSEMVEAAVRLAKATEALPAMLKAKAVSQEPVARAEEEILDEDILEVDVVGPVAAAAETAKEDAKLAKTSETAEKTSTASVAFVIPDEPAPSTEAVADGATGDYEKNPHFSQNRGEVGNPSFEEEKNLSPNHSSVVSPAPTVVPIESPVLAPQVLTPAAHAPSVAPQAPGSPKALFWSAAAVGGETTEAAKEDQSNVPPVLRGLKKCEACGFPISGGRVLCVECEEKKWRGQLRRQVPMPTGAIPDATDRRPGVQALAAAVGSLTGVSAQTPAPVAVKTAEVPGGAATESIKVAASAAPVIRASESIQPTETLNEAPIFSASLGPSQSWLGRNKYILGVLILAAGAVAAFLLFR